MSSEAGPRRVREAPRASIARPLHLRIAAILFVFGALFIAFSWSRDFWAPEEDDFAAITKEMGDRGSWIVPTLAGEPYFEKPPLLYWCGLLSEHGLRLPPPLGYRLVAALAGVLGLWVTYLAGLRFFNRPIALAAVFIEGTTILYYRMSSWYLTDGLFASSIALALTAGGMAVLWEPKERKWRFIAVAGWAGACLSKSPLLGTFLIGAPFVLFLVFFRKSLMFVHDLRRLRPLRGALVVLAIVAPWYLWMTWLHGTDFLAGAFVEQHLDRLAGATSHAHSAGYYLATLPVDLLPWSFFLPLAIFYAHAHYGRSSQKFFLFWAVVTFVSLSLVSSKQGKYLLPMWPPLSILVAASLLDTERESIWERYFEVAAFALVRWLLVGVSAAALVLLVPVAGGMLPAIASSAAGTSLLTRWGVRDEALESLQGMVGSLAFQVEAALLLAAIAAAFFVAARRIRRALADQDTLSAIAWLAGAVVVVLFVFSPLQAELDAVKSARPFCEEVREAAGDRPLAIYGRARGALVYYLDRPLMRFPAIGVEDALAGTGAEKPIEEYLRRGDRVFLVISAHDFDRLADYYPKLKRLVREVLRGMVGSRRVYLFLENRPSG